MKIQKFFIWLIALSLLFLLAPQTVKAEEISSKDSLSRLVDDADLLTEAEKYELVSELDRISLENDIDLVVVTALTLDGENTLEYAERYYDEKGYGFDKENDGVILLINLEDSDWGMVASGLPSVVLSAEVIESVADRFLKSLDTSGFAACFLEYAYSVEYVWNNGRVPTNPVIGVDEPVEATDDLSENEFYTSKPDIIENPQTAEDYEKLGRPAPKRLSPRLVDDADLLTSVEEEELLARLDAISEKYQQDLVIITNYSLNDKSATEFADDFFDYHGYGFGQDSSGILLLISMEYRDWALSTSGSAIKTFTDAGQTYMTENFLSYISDENYDKGFHKFIDLSENFLEQARTGQPYDYGNMPKKPLAWYWLPITLAVSFLIALGIQRSMKSKLKSVRRQEAADDYIRMNSFQLSDQRDLFLYKNVSRTIKPETSSSGGGGGGSRTHSSSSGSSHGGSSGKF